MQEASFFVAAFARMRASPQPAFLRMRLHRSAMRDLWSSPLRTGPQLQSLEYRFEKMGLLLERQPIPWNADAVLVDAFIRQSVDLQRSRKDYVLSVTGTRLSYTPHEASPGTPERAARLEFRLPVPRQRTTVELKWRTRPLGQRTLPGLR